MTKKKNSNEIEFKRAEKFQSLEHILNFHEDNASTGLHTHR